MAFSILFFASLTAEMLPGNICVVKATCNQKSARSV